MEVKITINRKPRGIPRATATVSRGETGMGFHLAILNITALDPLLDPMAQVSLRLTPVEITTLCAELTRVGNECASANADPKENHGK